VYSSRPTLGDRWIFLFGFPKSERGNIDRDEEQALKKVAATLLALSQEDIEKAVSAGELMEVDCGTENKITDS
jgi:hypothetical protein